MDPNRARLPTALANFRRENGDAGAALLGALGELAGGLDKDHPDLDLNLLVHTASIHQARRHPEQPLDQQQARKRYWALFEQLEALKLGRSIQGRRSHRTRFRVLADRPDGNPVAFVEALNALATDPGPRRPDQASGTRERGAALRRKDVIGRLRSQADEVHRLGVQSLFLFGSVARDEARPDSDVDLLATFESPVTSDAFFGAKFFLEDLLGKRIDLVTESALRGPIRQTIEPELIRVA
jgi:predicted nucleotidyltransferase